MPAISIAIGTLEFRTKGDAEKHIISVRDRYLGRLGEPVGTEDHEFLQSLIEMHPQYEEKFRCGIQSFFVEKAAKWNNHCFYLKRVDGSTEHFSFKECLKPSTPHQKFQTACRNAIKTQRDEARRSFLGTDSWPTDSQGRPLPTSEVDIDHEEPQFKKIVEDFIFHRKLDVEAVRYIEDGDRNFTTLFEDSILHAEFEEYHRRVAVLRPLSKQANIRRKRK